MRPVADKFPESQAFGSMATAGVAANSDPNSGVGYYVYLYGNYQPYGHAGLDIACPTGTPVYAMAAGTVLWADWGTNLPGDDSDWGYRQRFYLYKGFPGIVTVIQHNGWKGVYAHKSEAWMNVGDVVREGQQIGLSGGTGGVAPHLHVEALVDDSYSTGNGLIYGRTDPSKYFGTTATPTKDWFELATEAQLRKIVREEGVGYRNPALEKDDLYAIFRATRTYVVKNNAELLALKAMVGQLAALQGVAIDYAKIDAIVAKNIAAGVDVDITVNGVAK